MGCLGLGNNSQLIVLAYLVAEPNVFPEPATGEPFVKLKVLKDFLPPYSVSASQPLDLSVIVGVPYGGVESGAVYPTEVVVVDEEQPLRHAFNP